jgi:small-conductance mechanosensitive channel
MFLKILKYSFALIVFIVTISAYLGSWEQMPIVIGFLTVAMGLALQKPISSILAWIIIATRKPFAIGDRIIVDAIKGDVRDITLTHTYLDEIGGTIDGEERSEREVVIPNSFLFDKDIINYTARNDYILDEIKTSVTYESNLKKAEDIIIKETKKIMVSYWDTLPKKYQKEPHIRLRFKESGIDVTVRFYSIALSRNEISTNITRSLFNQIKKSKDVEIAYPHTEVVLRNK